MVIATAKISFGRLVRRYVSDKKRAAAAEAKRSATLRELQAACPHEKVAECDYLHMDYFSPMRPMRVCETCGLWEEGWSFLVLTPDRVRPLSRDEVYKLRQWP